MNTIHGDVVDQIIEISCEEDKISSPFVDQIQTWVDMAKERLEDAETPADVVKVEQDLKWAVRSSCSLLDG